ncbi:WD40/YVTN/BNR-like repeat-containing protein [Salinimicrobium oceani]|uniref:Oxidoreductase n=1 Tax=Salinimicrobium oceani TaxID=2722702 RepID=A0ABX1D0C3_9FLAO|nr:oxidoreductase [Salinimicrobium oceani]NJW52787.1 oxidoreductase [Salinimicrobium oceani]
MKRFAIILCCLVMGCKSDSKQDKQEAERNLAPKAISTVEIDMLLEDSISIRAIEVVGEDVVFAGSNGAYGIYNSANDEMRVDRQQYDTVYPEFRAVAATSNDIFLLSVGNPALLYKTGNDGLELVYTEAHEKVFYDAMTFWNDQEGIAMGDPVEDCLSIIITRDGGKSWKKISCNDLPKAAEGEAAFAASNSNIAVEGDKAWILSGGVKSRIFFTPNKGRSWEVFNTPVVQGKSTQGGYSLDFYDEQQGVIIGGDYTAPVENSGNKARTTDGGRTWTLIADNQNPGYKSSIRYFPNGNGDKILAVGFTGISYSADAGASWKQISDEGFYTLRFVNDTVAYAAGKNKLAKLYFK